VVSQWPTSGNKDWWAVHTKARHEKVTAKAFDRLGLSCYLPLVNFERRTGGRSVHVQLPLFPGYLFLRADGNERLAALQTRKAVRIFGVGDQEQFQESLNHIHQMVTSDQPVDVYPGIQEGRRCRITRGPLRGLEGTVIRRRGVSRIFVALEVLGQSAETEIDGASLDVLD
jgi:transcription antitermination factor NusG